MITDSCGRTINYLRLAVTDCMPKDGPRRELKLLHNTWPLRPRQDEKKLCSYITARIFAVK